MSGTWNHRVVKDEDGTLHFAAVRFRPMENTASGIVDIFNGGKSMDEMRSLASELLRACDLGVIDVKDGVDPDFAGEDEDEDE
jgi:hypothetical protein